MSAIQQTGVAHEQLWRKADLHPAGPGRPALVAARPRYTYTRPVHSAHPSEGPGEPPALPEGRPIEVAYPETRLGRPSIGGPASPWDAGTAPGGGRAEPSTDGQPLGALGRIEPRHLEAWEKMLPLIRVGQRMEVHHLMCPIRPCFCIPSITEPMARC